MRGLQGIKEATITLPDSAPQVGQRAAVLSAIKEI